MRTLRLLLILLLLLCSILASYAQSDYKSDSIKIQSLLNQGRQEYNKSADTAIKTIEKGLSIARKGGYKWLEAECLAALSSLYTQVRRDIDARYASEKALSLFETLKDTQKMVRLYNAMGWQFRIRGDYKKAFEYTFRAVHIAKKASDRKLLLNPYVELAITHDALERYDSALFYNDLAIRLAQSFRDTILFNFQQVNRAVTYSRMELYDSALRIYQRIIPYFEARSNPDEIFICYENVGIVFMRLKRYAEAEDYLMKAMQLAETMRPASREQGAAGLAELYELKGDYAKSVKWYKRQMVLRDTVFNLAKSEQLTEMETKYETEKKQEAILKLNQDAQLKDAQISRQNLLRNLIIAVALFVVLIAGILYRNYKRSQRFNRQLEEQKARLEELDVIKNKLFSAISHDLRSPMMSLDATLELLRDENITQEKLQRYTTHLNTSMNATLNLLDNLLNWSLSQMKGLNLAPATVNLKELAEENIQLYSSAAEKKNIRIVSEIDEHTAVHVDRNIGRLVLRNLINNAIKFTPEKGQIILSSAINDDEVEIRIKDNGIGMAAEHVKMLFELRTGNTRQGTAKEKGTGLGLVLCRELIEKSGGNISVESEVGKGSTFAVRLPKSTEETIVM